ncbi:hypothetical protein [Aquicoccus sp. SU-CL01552]|uniref:hypothetical protein n=1 Tax=Aquicoccus sp. SU-CL01552 TaxID=3127656 RepID=UPI0031059D2E
MTLVAVRLAFNRGYWRSISHHGEVGRHQRIPSTAHYFKVRAELKNAWVLLKVTEDLFFKFRSSLEAFMCGDTTPALCGLQFPQRGLKFPPRQLSAEKLWGKDFLSGGRSTEALYPQRLFHYIGG